MRNRGFGQVQLIILASCIGLVIIFALGCYWHGVNVGRQEIRQEWQAAVIKADAELRDKHKAVEKALTDAKKKADDAEARAEIHYQNLREVQREAKRNGKPLGSCVADRRSGDGAAGTVEPGKTEGQGLRAPASASGAPAAGGSVLLRWRFVGLHDSAFTGLDGKPLFQASAGYALDPARADADSRYALEDALAVSQENAAKFSSCRRAVAKARAVVEEAAKAWDAAR